MKRMCGRLGGQRAGVKSWHALRGSWAEKKRGCIFARSTSAGVADILGSYDCPAGSWDFGIVNDSFHQCSFFLPEDTWLFGYPLILPSLKLQTEYADGAFGDPHIDVDEDADRSPGADAGADREMGIQSQRRRERRGRRRCRRHPSRCQVLLVLVPSRRARYLLTAMAFRFTSLLLPILTSNFTRRPFCECLAIYRLECSRVCEKQNMACTACW